MIKKISLLMAFTLATNSFASTPRIVTVDEFKSPDLSKTWLPPANSDTLIGVSSTNTIINKTIDGASNTFSGIPTSAVNGLTGTNTGDVTLDVANGLSLVGQSLSLQLADTTHTGALSVTDYNYFNNKPNANEAWVSSGNSGTNGTAVLGTTDAQPWTTVAGGVFVDSYQTDGSVSSILNITQPDATNFAQKRNQVNLTAAAPITSGVFFNQNNSVGYSSAFDYAGNISGVGASVDIGTTSAVNFASASENSIFLHGGGTTNLVKGVNMNAGVASGTNVNSYNGIFSSINSTGGIFGGASLFAGGGGFTDVSSGNITGYGINFNVAGASVLTQGTQIFSGSSNFNGTTTVSQNIQGTSVSMQLADSVEANGGMIGNNANIQLKDNSTSQNINAQQLDIALNNNSVATGANIISSQYQIHDNANGGNVNHFGGGLQMDGASTLSGYNGMNLNAQTSGTVSVTNSINLISAGSNIGGNSTMNSHNGMIIPLTVKNSAALSGGYTGMFLSQFLQDSASTNNMFGIDLSMQLNDTSTIANQYSGMKISMQTQGGDTFDGTGNLQGLEINLSGANLSPAKKAAGNQKNGIIVNDGTLNSQYNWQIPGNTFFGSVNNLGGTVQVVSGDPVVNALAVANNLGVGLDFQDNWGPDFTGLRLGFISNGSVANIGGAAGKTVDAVTQHLVAMSNQSGGGNIDKGVGVASMGFLPSGGTLAVNNFFAFEAGPTICAIVSGGNCWAFHDKSGGAENFLGKLAIGTSTEKVANSDTALEIGNNKAFLNGRGTTVQKNALAAVAGMQFYDTDLNFLQFYDSVSWVNTGGTSGGSGTVTSVSVSSANGFAGTVNTPSTTPEITISTTITGLLKGDGTAISAAIANTDYLPATTGSNIQKADGAGGLEAAVSGVDFQAPGNYITDLTGDGTASGPNSAVFTLATVNASPGTFGTVSQTNQVAVNGKGLVTAVTAQNIQIAESQVTNLVSDLAGKQAAFTWAQETPSGTVNNSNTAFTLAHTPVSNASVHLHLDGLILVQGTDYTISGSSITMTGVIPNFGQTLYADYAF